MAADLRRLPRRSRSPRAATSTATRWRCRSRSRPGSSLLVSLWLKNSSLPDLPENSWASGAQTWFAAGRHARTRPPTPPAPRSPGPGRRGPARAVVLTGLDVTTPAVTLGRDRQPGRADGGGGRGQRDRRRQLRRRRPTPRTRRASGWPAAAAQGLAAGTAWSTPAIESNQVLSDGTTSGGVSLLARLDRDVLAEPDVGTVIIDEGLQDLLRRPRRRPWPGNLEDAYQALENQLQRVRRQRDHRRRSRRARATRTPTAGDSCSTGTASVDAGRRTSTPPSSGHAAPDCYADFDGAVSNGASPEALACDRRRRR